MVELLQLIPFPLLLLSIVLVILPTIFTAIVRIRLYNYLIFLKSRVRRLIHGVSPSEKPGIIEHLEARFQTASENLEEVNTAALVDGVYSQEKFDFLRFKLRCHQWHYFSQALPNLLISFGLLGTFLGITLNLSTLIQTINQVKATDINNLVEQLQDPIQGMGIAFITSLIAIACSSLLTVINLQCNTNLAREDLISYLEDYLDNILQPTIEGKSRLDKAVKRMVKQQNDFLNKFYIANKINMTAEELDIVERRGIAMQDERGRITYAEQQGELRLIMRQLKKRFGEIPEAIISQVEDLSVADLENLGEDFLDFNNLEDLLSWLQERS
ncbi:DUF4351 domain-containing protein [Okeania sp. SIO2C2]|uniref:DUF4351 domain-containing protein n=1 Tax=Okeania sp. SIO2C2 TaxID=2607787 RepID=UPI00257E9B6D|nr:DUF4351 domain-containing protein [Okeania sp. SIO2C2]